MGILNKEEKGFHCDIKPDGTTSCESVIKDKKTGEILGDGQRMNIAADPSDGCKPRLTGDFVAFDDQLGRLDEVAGRVSKGCKKQGN